LIQKTANTEKGDRMKHLKAPRRDLIGDWTREKLKIFENYTKAYSKALAGKFHRVYVDAFAGAGEHICRKTLEYVPGSPRNALAVEHPFEEYHFIDIDQGRAEGLEELKGLVPTRVEIHHGDCNTILREEILPYIASNRHIRALCMLDPYSLNYDWDVVCGLAKTQHVDLFLNFMIMNANMNVLHRDQTTVDPLQAERLTKVWGSEEWRNHAYYSTEASDDLFGNIETKKTNNIRVANAYRKRLQLGAGFKHVLPPIPMLNSRGGVIYYLYFAAQNDLARAHLKNS
jgi:three-Cys-motif partner protein